MGGAERANWSHRVTLAGKTNRFIELSELALTRKAVTPTTVELFAYRKQTALRARASTWASAWASIPSQVKAHLQLCHLLSNHGAVLGAAKIGTARSEILRDRPQELVPVGDMPWLLQGLPLYRQNTISGASCD